MIEVQEEREAAYVVVKAFVDAIVECSSWKRTPQNRMQPS